MQKYLRTETYASKALTEANLAKQEEQQTKKREQTGAKVQPTAAAVSGTPFTFESSLSSEIDYTINNCPVTPFNSPNTAAMCPPPPPLPMPLSLPPVSSPFMLMPPKEEEEEDMPSASPPPTVLRRFRPLSQWTEEQITAAVVVTSDRYRSIKIRPPPSALTKDVRKNSASSLPYTDELLNDGQTALIDDPQMIRAMVCVRITSRPSPAADHPTHEPTYDRMAEVKVVIDFLRKLQNKPLMWETAEYMFENVAVIQTSVFAQSLHEILILLLWWQLSQKVDINQTKLQFRPEQLSPYYWKCVQSSAASCSKEKEKEMEMSCMDFQFMLEPNNEIRLEQLCRRLRSPEQMKAAVASVNSGQLDQKETSLKIIEDEHKSALGCTIAKKSQNETAIRNECLKYVPVRLLRFFLTPVHNPKQPLSKFITPAKCRGLAITWRSPLSSSSSSYPVDKPILYPFKEHDQFRLLSIWPVNEYVMVSEQQLKEMKEQTPPKNWNEFVQRASNVVRHRTNYHMLTDPHYTPFQYLFENLTEEERKYVFDYNKPTAAAVASSSSKGFPTPDDIVMYLENKPSVNNNWSKFIERAAAILNTKSPPRDWHETVVKLARGLKNQTERTYVLQYPKKKILIHTEFFRYLLTKPSSDSFKRSRSLPPYAKSNSAASTVTATAPPPPPPPPLPLPPPPPLPPRISATNSKRKRTPNHKTRYLKLRLSPVPETASTATTVVVSQL